MNRFLSTLNDENDTRSFTHAIPSSIATGLKVFLWDNEKKKRESKEKIWPESVMIQKIYYTIVINEK